MGNQEQLNIRTRVSKLTKQQQSIIICQLKQNGYLKEDVENAMSSRLCDLVDSVDIESVVL